MRTTILLIALTVLAQSSAASADDWPRWLGPRGDSVWRESGIVEQLPEGDPKVLWRAPVELGYSGPAVVGNRVFVTDYVKRSGKIKNNAGARDKLEGTERILCFAADTGKLLWKHEYDRPYNLSFPGGPRCTPSVDADKVYTLGAEGNLVCLAADTGRVLWQKDFVKEYAGVVPIWGCAAHPLVDGDALYCVVGGPGCLAMAFDKNTGRELWRSLSAREPGYCPPTIIKHGGRRQLLIWDCLSLSSLDPTDGKVFWAETLKPAYGMAIAPPRKSGSRLFASAFGNAGALLKLDDSRPAAEVVWRGEPKSAVYSANVTPVIDDGVIYGCDIQTGALMAARLADGERLWQTVQPTLGQGKRGRYGTAFLVKHRDRYFLLSETGELILAKLTPQGYEELGRTRVLEPTNSAFGRKVVWSHPAFANRCMVARNDKEVVCVSLAAE